jgi:hypothetical protein
MKSHLARLTSCALAGGVRWKSQRCRDGDHLWLGSNLFASCRIYDLPRSLNSL